MAWLIHESRSLFIVYGALLEWPLFIEYSAVSDLCICDMTHSWESGSFYRVQCCPGLYLYNVVLFWTGAYVAGLIHQSRALLLYSIVIFRTSAFVAWLIHESRALFIVLGTLLEWLLFIEYSALSDLCICGMTCSWKQGYFIEYSALLEWASIEMNIVLFRTSAYVTWLICESRALVIEYSALLEWASIYRI